MPFHDYESWGAMSVQPHKPALLEAYSGSSIVAWYGNIERQIQNMIQTYESGRNHNYADKLRQFLNTWRANQISGSINRETLDPLEAASSQLAVDSWRCSNYFSNLRDSLRRLIASEEELPRTPQQAPQPGADGGVPPPPSSDFGPQDEQPAPGSPEEIGNPPDENDGGAGAGGQPTGDPNAPGGAAPGAPGAAPGGPAGAPPATPVGQPTAG